MKYTPYSKTCSKSSRKFFDDFDLLPPDFKHLLENLSYMPTMEDLKTAWELAAEDSSLDKLIASVNCLPKPLKVKKSKQQRQLERFSRLSQGQYRDHTTLMRVNQAPKDARLVLRLTEGQAQEVLAKRKENIQVRPVTYYYETPIDPFARAKKRNAKKGDKTLPEKVIRDSMAKSMHNAGGKK